MKRFLSVFVLFAFMAITCNAGEVNYYNKSWAEIKAKAKVENKYIMVDCYTDWCSWCKVMDKETMTDDGIIATLNDKFIAVKMDMEKGEGVLLAMKYHILGYPSFMFFAPDGSYVYEAVGYQKKDAFAKELTNARDKSKQFTAPGFSDKLVMDYPAFYKKMFAGNGKREFPTPVEVNTYLDNQKDLFTEVNWAVISRSELNEKYTNFFLDNMAKYKSLYGHNSVDDKLNSVLSARLRYAVTTKNKEELNAVLALVDKYVTEDPAMLKESFSISFYMETKDWVNCVAAVDKFIAQKGYENSSFINSLGWTLYKECDDKKLLKKACAWMKEVTAKEPQYAYMDTYAALLSKTGQKAEAKEMAKKAIAAGKKAGDDTKETEKLLSKLETGK